MPNWCENYLTVRGDKKHLENFKDRLRSFPASYSDEIDLNPIQKPIYTFNSLVPVPSEVEEKGYDKAGYDWCRIYWGTEWDADFTIKEESDNHIYFILQTAWSPPDEWFRTVVPIFPKLEFTLQYWEHRSGIAGEMIGKNGELEECHYNYFRDDEKELYLEFVEGVFCESIREIIREEEQ